MADHWIKSTIVFFRLTFILFLFARLVWCICPSGSLPMPPLTGSGPSCFIILDWLDIAIMRKEVVRDKPAMKTEWDPINDYTEMRADTRLQAKKMCQRMGGLNGTVQVAPTTPLQAIYRRQKLINLTGYHKWYKDLALISDHVKFILPNHTNDTDMKAFVRYVSPKLQSMIPAKEASFYSFFIENTQKSANQVQKPIAPTSKLNPDWIRARGKHGCGYYAISPAPGDQIHTHTGVYWLDCDKSFNDTTHEGSSTWKSPVIICQFDEPEDCVLQNYTTCEYYYEGRWECKGRVQYNKSGSPLGRPCDEIPTEGPRSDWPDCSTRFVPDPRRECKRNCRWGPWSGWGDCEPEDCVLRTRKKVVVEHGEFAVCHGVSQMWVLCQTYPPQICTGADPVFQSAAMVVLVIVASLIQFIGPY